MGAALGQAPVDSQGTKELLDLVKDMGAPTATLAETTAELVKEIRDRPQQPPPTTRPMPSNAKGPAGCSGSPELQHATGCPRECRNPAVGTAIHADGHRPLQQDSCSRRYAAGNFGAGEW